MKQFVDDSGRTWIATAVEEDTPRHHGNWYLVFQPADEPARRYAMPEVRWQTAATAARTLRTMSDFELRRRLNSTLIRRAHAERDGEGKAARAQPAKNAR